MTLSQSFATIVRLFFCVAEQENHQRLCSSSHYSFSTINHQADYIEACSLYQDITYKLSQMPISMSFSFQNTFTTVFFDYLHSRRRIRTLNHQRRTSSSLFTLEIITSTADMNKLLPIMCKYHVYYYASCRHSKLIRTDRCWEDQVDGCFTCFSLSSWLYPSGTHCKLTIRTTVIGSCRDCIEHQMNITRGEYGNFVTQPMSSVGGSQGASQTQAPDYSCGGLNERPVRAPERSYQPDGYQPEDQMSYPAPEQSAPEYSGIPSYGYAKQLYRSRFLGQPSRLQVSHGRDGIELTNLQLPSNRQNKNRSVNNFLDPSPYELQVSSESSRVESESLRATSHDIRTDPSPYELQASLSNSDSVGSTSGDQEGNQDNTGNKGRPRRRARRGNMNVMDRLPRPASEPRDCERPPVHDRVAALRGERRCRPTSRSSIGRSQAVSPLTESDLRAPFVPIPEHDEYPEYPAHPPYI